MLKKLLNTTAILSALLGSAATATAQNATPRPGGTAVVVVATELQTLNPAITSGSGEGVVGCMIHEGLVEIDGNGNPVPDLAKSWTISEDGLTYSFDLVDTSWHDSKPFTARDVVYSFKNVNSRYAPLFSAQLAKRIADVQATSDRQVVVKLTEPFGPFLRMLTCWNGGAIVPEHVFQGTDPTRNPRSAAPIGTGPFKFDEWRSGDSIRLSRNTAYWKPGRPYLDGVVVRFMPNPASRVQAMLAGEADFIQKYFLPVSDIPTVGRNPALKLEPASQAPNSLLGFFNVTKRPFDDKRLRQALFGMIDRRFIVRAAFSGQGEPGTAPFPRGISWAADPGLNYDQMYKPDAAAANALLDQLGLPRGAGGVRLRTSISFEVGIPERLRSAIAIQAAWKPLGIEVELRPLEPAVLAPRVFKDGDYDIALFSYGTYGDPALGIARTYISSMIGFPNGNGARYSNPAVDQLFERAASLAETQARGDLYRQIQRILADDLPVMTLQENRGVDAASARLNGIWGFEGAGRFGEAWFSR
jgi:peptide/nickel transport system substrate-binding protein